MSHPKARDSKPPTCSDLKHCNHESYALPTELYWLVREIMSVTILNFSFKNVTMAGMGKIVSGNVASVIQAQMYRDHASRLMEVVPRVVLLDITMILFVRQVIKSNKTKSWTVPNLTIYQTTKF